MNVQPIKNGNSGEDAEFIAVTGFCSKWCCFQEELDVR